MKKLKEESRLKIAQELEDEYNTPQDDLISLKPQCCHEFRRIKFEEEIEIRIDAETTEESGVQKSFYRWY